MYYNLSFTLKDKRNYFNSGKNNKYYGVELEELLALIEDKDISDFIDLLIKNKNEVIYTNGLAFSYFIAQYFTRNL